jgi:hypothetical protein
MRLTLFVPAALVLGAALGLAAAYWEYGGPASAQAAAAARSADEQQPVAVVDEGTHKFGVMELGAKKSHSFTVSNKGKAPLKLEKGETTCKCTLSHLEDSSIPPGSSGSVALEWEGKGEIGPFRQTAEILTNDPKQPKLLLTVEGELTEAVSVEPAELVLSSLSARDPVTGEVRIYALHSDDFEVMSHKFESETGNQQFEVVFEPLDEKLLADHKAKSGVLAKVTTKPILPLGPIKQKIILETNLANRPQLEFTVAGTVVSDISVLGQDFSSSNSMLRLGLVKSRDGAKRTLRLVTRGAFRKEIEFKVASKSPEFLEVAIGERIDQGLVTQVPITISVPAGTPPANHLGTALGKMGEIVLETNHPDLKQVPIKVYFAVED